MRVMIQFSFPADTGNTLISSGKLGGIFHHLMEDLKPEAAYFFPEKGQRGGLMVVNMSDSSDLARLLEPFWIATKADISVKPVMNAEDLGKGLSGIEDTLKRYA